MENISITTYRGLSLVSGSISIRQMFEFIRGDVYRDRIRRLRDIVTVLITTINTMRAILTCRN